MMDRQQQPARSSRAGVEPDRLHHHPRTRRKPVGRRLRLLGDAGAQRSFGQPMDIDPPQARLRIDAAAAHDLQRKLRTLPGRNEPQPQRIVMLEHRLQRAGEVIAPQPRRHLQQHRLMEALERPATLGQPAHDRQRRQATGRQVGHARGRRRNRLGNRRQPRNRLMLEHRARRDRQPGLARPAHQLDRDDAVAAERKEVVVDADPRQPQNLGKQRAQKLLLRRARQPPHLRHHRLRRRQRTAVELAVGRERKPLHNHQRRRHHVLRKAPPQMRAQRRSIEARASDTRASIARVRSGRSHHIADQPPARAFILARNHRRLRHPGMAHQRRLDLARLDPEPAQLHLRIGPPEKLQNPVATPARQVPGPVHPAPASPEPVRNEPLRGQPGTPEIAARKPRARNVKLPRNPGRHGHQAAVQNINPRS